MSGEFTMSQEEQASRARMILEDPLFERVLWELDSGAVDTWRRSTNADQRELQWHMVTAIAALVAQLKRRLDTAKMSHQQQVRNAGQRRAGV